MVIRRGFNRTPPVNTAQAHITPAREQFTRQHQDAGPLGPMRTLHRERQANTALPGRAELPRERLWGSLPRPSARCIDYCVHLSIVTVHCGRGRVRRDRCPREGALNVYSSSNSGVSSSRSNSSSTRVAGKGVMQELCTLNCRAAVVGRLTLFSL